MCQGPRDTIGDQMQDFKDVPVMHAQSAAHTPPDVKWSTPIIAVLESDQDPAGNDSIAGEFNAVGF